MHDITLIIFLHQYLKTILFDIVLSLPYFLTIFLTIKCTSKDLGE